MLSSGKLDSKQKLEFCVAPVIEDFSNDHPVIFRFFFHWLNAKTKRNTMMECNRWLRLLNNAMYKLHTATTHFFGKNLRHWWKFVQNLQYLWIYGKKERCSVHAIQWKLGSRPTVYTSELKMRQLKNSSTRIYRVSKSSNCGAIYLWGTWTLVWNTCSE